VPWGLRSLSCVDLFVCIRCWKLLHFRTTGVHILQILIVDDEQPVRLLLSRSFERAGYEVAVAATAIDAMSLCEERPFNAVLSDVDMRGMNGHELVRWIATHHPNTLCVLMSGLGSECHECPFVNRCLLLRKPFDAKDGVALITRALSAKAN
jgi:DNA-binding NtrC family response regulator